MKFSILLPAYKKKYLYECIESCLAQTYSDFEIIIVDDASPEDLKAVVGQFSDIRIRYYRNEKNCGALHVVDNWNICLGLQRVSMLSVWVMMISCCQIVWRNIPNS